MENREDMTITRMDRTLYDAAAKGNIMAFKEEKFDQPLETLLTPNKNTVLHVFIKNQIESKDVKNSVRDMCCKYCRIFVRDMLCNRKISVRDNKNFVGEILSKCPSLLCQVNVKDETPLHLAARYGHAKIVEVLIERASDSHNQDLESGVKPVKEMLGMVNKEKNTALHEAVIYNHLEVTKHLISADPDFPYCVNNEGKTPIYIAAERNHGKLVKEILQNCISPTYDGPFGRTALHAAIFCDRQEIIDEIREKFGEAMTKKADQKGWTPLHLAAYSNREIHTKSLLECDSQVAYMKDKEGRTALHLAAHRGNIDVMETIIDKCPDCCDLVDDRGCNALHFAMEGDSPDSVVKVILKKSSFFPCKSKSAMHCALSNLLNEKNAEGNTPLHRQYSRGFEDLNEDLKDHPRADKMALNKNNHTAYQVALTSGKLSTEKMIELGFKHWNHSTSVFLEEEETELAKYVNKDLEKTSRVRMKEYLDKAAESHLVVATLITTVTFAAAITMPGGFVGVGDDPHYEGSPVLRRNIMFKAFIITDAISLVLSSCAVVIHLLMPLLLIKVKHSKSYETRDAFLKLAFKFILMAMGAMVLAFITGAYAVLAYSSQLAIATCVIGSFFFLILSLISGIYSKDLGLGRYITKKFKLFLVIIVGVIVYFILILILILGIFFGPIYFIVVGILYCCVKIYQNYMMR